MSQRVAATVAATSIAIVLAACASIPGPPSEAPPTSGPCRGHTRIEWLAQGSIGARWNNATRTLAFGRPRADGTYAIWLSDADGRSEHPLVVPRWPEDRHQFPGVWHPSGRYLFATVEKAEVVPEKGHRRARVDATPGYGAYTDLWLATPDGNWAWRLTDLPNDWSHGITHMAITPDGRHLTWTERIAAPRFLDMNLMAGGYVFKVADFVDGPTPRLENVRTLQPGGVLAAGEVDGISADGSVIAFYSTFETKNLFNTPIYTMDLRSGVTHRLTTDSFAQAPQFTPDGQSIVYMTGSGADIFFLELQGADWWIMSTDGSHKRRLTFMNRRGHPQSFGHYRLAGTISFIDDNTFYGDVMTKPLGLVGDIVRVHCD